MEIAELEVKIISDAQKAAAALDSLADSAKTLQKSINIDTSSIAGLKDIKDLAQIDGKKLEAIGEGMSKLSEGFAQFRNVKMADVTRAGKAITSLNEVKADKIAEIGAAIQPLAKSLAELSGVQFDSRNVTNFLNALGRLSGTDTTALQNLNFSAVGRSIRQLTQELADAPKINQSVISMTSAVANLAKSGSNIPIVTQSLGSLGTGLKDFMNVMSVAPKISTNTIQFTQALGTLANAGAKAETTAKHLGTLAQELRGFMQVMSTAPRISANTVQMTTALANLANAGSRVGRSSTTLINGLNNTSKSMNKAATSAKSLARAFGKFYANWFLVIRGIKGIWKSIESSMDYIEVLNYFNAAFGQVAESAVNQWEKAGYDSAESYYNSFSQRAQQLTTKMTGFTISDSGMLEATGGKSLGINPKDLMNYQAMFAQMSNSMGVTAETSLKLSTALTEIGADLASVRNIKFDKVWTDMASGLAGMSRTLDKYGANIRNVNLQQKLNEIGIKASITALNQNEKALLRTIILLDSTRYAWGDLAETINSPANQLRLLEANFNNLARTIGNIFLPIVAKVLPYINALVSALQRLAQFIVKLLGFEGFDWGGASGTGGGFDELIGGAEDLEEGLDGASGAAKKLNKQIRAFDELNVITMPEETTGAGGGLGGGIDTGLLEGALDDILDEYQTAWDKAFDEMEERANQFADNVAKAFQTGGLFGVGRYLSESLTGALNSIPWESIYEGARTFGTGLAEFLNGLITPDLFATLGQTIAKSLNTALEFLNSFGTKFNWKDFGNSIAVGINTFFKNFKFRLLAKTLNTWANGLLDAMLEALDRVEWKKIGEGIGDFLYNLDYKGISIKAARVFVKTLKAGFTTVLSALKIDTKPVENMFDSLEKLVSNVAGGIVDGLTAILPHIKNVLGAGITALATAFDALFKVLSLVPSDIWGALAGGVATFLAVFYTYKGVSALVSGITTAFSNFTTSILTFIAANPVVAAVGALSAVGGALITLEDEWTNAQNEIWKKEQIEQYGDTLDNIKQKYQELATTAVEESANRLKGVQDTTGTETLLIQGIADKYLELADKVRNSGEGYGELKLAAQNLIDYFPELQQYYDSTTGLINVQEDAIKSLVEQKKKEIELNAISEAWQDALKDQIQAEKDFKDIREKHSEASSKLLEIERNLSDVEGNGRYTDEELAAYNEQVEAVKSYGDALKSTKETLDTYNSEVEYYSGKYAEVAESTSNSADTIKQSVENVADIDLSEKGTQTAGTYVSAEVEKLNSSKEEVQTAAKGMYASDESYEPIGEKQAGEVITGAKGKFTTEAGIETSTPYGEGLSQGIINSFDDGTLTETFNQFGTTAAEDFKTGFSENLATVTDAIQEWVDSISETFTKDVFSEAFNNLVEGLKAKWNEFASWWSDEAMPQWKDENTSTWFSYETWFDMLEPPRTSFVDTLEEIQETWNDTSETWFDTDLTNFYSEAKWLGLLRPVINAFESSFNTVKSSVSSRMNDVYSNVRSVVSNITSAIREIESACSSATSAINNLSSAASSISNISINASVSGYNIPQYATGGFPEDGWFRASKGEYFGQFDDGTSYVANNSQIEVGIAKGVEDAAYRGFMRAMRQSGGTQVTFKVEGDRDKIFKVTQEEASAYYQRTGNPAYEF